MNEISKFDNSISAPCIVTFEERSGVGPGDLIFVRTKAIFTFYRGGGQVSVVRLSNVEKEFGLPLIKAISEAKCGLEASCADIFPLDFRCQNLVEGVSCGHKAFAVTLDRRLDGFAIIRLTCSKCGHVIVQDVMSLDTRLTCMGCGEAKPDIRLSKDPQTGESKRLCSQCFETRKSNDT